MKFLHLCQLQQAETQPVAGGAGVFYAVFLSVEGGAQPFAVQMAVNTGIHAVFFEQFGKAAALLSVPKGRKVENRHDGPPL